MPVEAQVRRDERVPVLCRVMEEHLVVGKGVAMSRPDGERSVCGVQSPDDPEATYRA